jgi:hypothetical protein
MFIVYLVTLIIFEFVKRLGGYRKIIFQGKAACRLYKFQIWAGSVTSLSRAICQTLQRH